MRFVNSAPRPAKQKSPRGFGLISLRERATAVGGTLTVQSAPGEGTSIAAQIPFSKVRGGAASLMESIETKTELL